MVTKERSKGVIQKTVLYLLLLLLLIAFDFPFIWMALSSFRREVEVFYPGLIAPSPPTLEGYQILTTYYPFFRWIANSLLVAGLITIVSVFADSLAAYAFSRMKFWGREGIFSLLLLQLMIPVQTNVLPMYLIMNFLGWIDTYQALIVPMLGTVFGIFMMRQFFKQIPLELEDAARMDGCSRLGIFFRIILPLSKPALITLATFRFFIAWNQFLWPLVVTNQIEMFTVQVGLSMLASEVWVYWTSVMAGSVIASLPPIILFLVLEKYVVRGYLMAGIRG